MSQKYQNSVAHCHLRATYLLAGSVVGGVVVVVGVGVVVVLVVRDDFDFDALKARTVS